ncbi:MAG: hypothetical protein KIY12_00155 [Thermoplasmata archaeon]|uniref:YbaK/aminoacyl-tRNA synthetase-associated domain-containing protein n=1 Tax=Candidatus Sysuiplasma superficiale TaxID=2823368 RepID=A0A8J8CC89_9ARCH|nr:hypothetical protein [Candidatus Sysuiplasma superficiale]MBX8643135.1 hypothetical protein [Candidatus Sysuiplasma superficiale]MCL4346933.1 hypothetical protein [Candidatus Thermoplasmatota archaeon]
MKGIGEVRRFVLESGVDAGIIEFDDEGAARDSISAAAAAGCSTAEIAKTMAFECEADRTEGKERRTVLVVLSGDRMVDTTRLANTTGSVSARKLRPAEVLRLTGYPVGGVPPFPHDTGITVLADSSLFRFKYVWASAGAPNAIMKIRPELLTAVLGYSAVEVSTQ